MMILHHETVSQNSETNLGGLMLGHEVSVIMYIVKLQPLLLRKLFIKRLWFLAHPRSSLYIGSMLHLVYLYRAIGISLNNYANMLCDEHKGGA